MSYLSEKIDLKDKRHLLALLGILIIFLAIPITVTLVQQSREPASRAETIPNDPLYPQQWALPKIRAPQAWDVTTGSRAVKVAIVSTGIGSNTDVDPNLVPGYIALDPARNPCNCTLDGDGEGTQVAGVVGAVGNN